MKKLIGTSVLLFSLTVYAQDAGLPPRTMTKTETERWAFICEAFSRAVPESFKDYTVKRDNCGSFEWAERDRDHRPIKNIVVQVEGFEKDVRQVIRQIDWKSLRLLLGN